MVKFLLWALLLVSFCCNPAYAHEYLYGIPCTQFIDAYEKKDIERTNDIIKSVKSHIRYMHIKTNKEKLEREGASKKLSSTHSIKANQFVANFLSVGTLYNACKNDEEATVGEITEKLWFNVNTNVTH